MQQKTASAGWAAALENVINGGDRHELDEHREILSLTQWTGGRWSSTARAREGEGMFGVKRETHSHGSDSLGFYCLYPWWSTRER